MNRKFHEAFDSIHAADEMKRGTLSFLEKEYSKRQGRRTSRLNYYVSCLAVFLFLFLGFGGYQIYSTPVSYISVDVNPSVELGLNPFHLVVSVTSYNDDGSLVLQNLNLKNKTYTEAIELLLDDTTFEGYLTEESLLSFTVVSEDSDTLLNGIKQCKGYAEANAQCHGGDAQLVEDAHHNGLSFGKYQAYLELSQYDSTITVDDCRNMSMRQIRDLISQYEDGWTPPGEDEPEKGQSNGHHCRRGYCHGNRNQ